MGNCSTSVTFAVRTSLWLQGLTGATCPAQGQAGGANIGIAKAPVIFVERAARQVGLLDTAAVYLAITHRRYSGYINALLRVTGHLFQGRFGSVAEVSQFLATGTDPALEQALVQGQSIGRPLMGDTQLVALAKQLQRRLRPAPGGRPKNKQNEGRQIELGVNGKVSP